MERTWMVGFALVLAGWVPAAQARSAIGPLQNPAGWVIEAAEYHGEIRDQIARMEVRYTIRILRDGWTEVPLALHGAMMTDIAIERRVGEAHMMPRDGGYVLAAGRGGIYKIRVTCSTLLTQDSQGEGIQLDIPQATFSTLSLFVPRKDVELNPEDQLYVERTPDAHRGGVTLTARVGAADRIRLCWRTKPTAPVKVEPALYGELHTLATLEEQAARVTAIATYQISQGETRQLRLRIPEGVSVVSVRGSGIEDWRVSDDGGERVLQVTLGFVLKETTYQLIVEGEQAIESGTTYAVPVVALLDVKQERGYLAVARSGSIELAPATVNGATRIDVRELPDVLQNAVGSPILLAFKYHQHPSQVTLTVTRHQDHPVLAAIAERGELATVISRQGELLTRAAYLIRTNKKQFLEVQLPEGGILWSCLVDGQSVKPAQGEADRLLVPLDGGVGSEGTVTVELVYFERRPILTGVGRLALRGPVLDVPTTVSSWLVYAPESVKFLRMTGNLERGLAASDFLEEPLAQVAMAAESQVELADGLQKSGEVDLRLKRGFQGTPRSVFRRAREGLSPKLRAVIAGSKSEFEAKQEPSVEEAHGDLSSTNSPGDRDGKEGLGRGTFDNSMGLGRIAALQDRGIFPLKIRLPKTGIVYQFNRLMTSGEALTVEGTFVHLPVPWFSAMLGMALLPLAVLAVRRIRRA
ncbi:MAG: hypothetical protein HYZ91_06470 [Candidatus Omnitrophica bacterium]|nr:hypothetical protein [Candidatus Omnitrophota bacterium]